MTFLRVGGPPPRGEWEEHLVVTTGQIFGAMWCVRSVGMVSVMVFPMARDMAAAVAGGEGGRVSIDEAYGVCSYEVTDEVAKTFLPAWGAKTL